MLENLNKFDIILGSGSPRRSELLKELNLSFRIEVNGAEEDYPTALQAEEIPLFLAKKKADSYRLDNNALLITADTIVWGDNQVYDKPVDFEDGKKILRSLSGKMHQVITAVCIRSIEKERLFSVSTKVKFASISEEEIDFYLKNFKPYDKAGGYAIQEWIGLIGIESINGSYYNVVGLPVQQLYRELKAW